MTPARTAVSAALAALTAASAACAAFQNGSTRETCLALVVWLSGTLAAVLLWGDHGSRL